MADTANTIRQLIQIQPESQVQNGVKHYLNTEFNDLDSLLAGGGGGGSGGEGGPSRKKRRTLEQEIGYWETLENNASKELAVTSVELPKLLERTQTDIQELLSSAQGLSLRRYDLVDRLSRLIVDLNAESEDSSTGVKGTTTLDRLETLQEELERLEASLQWIETVERIVGLSEEILNVNNHGLSPLSVVPRYRDMCAIVNGLKRDLPAGMNLLEVVGRVRERTWEGLKEVMSQNLINASETLKWPTRVHYSSIPSVQRRAFERAYQDLLYLQAEGERLHPQPATHTFKGHIDWTSGHGLYPLQALVKPISLRFKYHFQGSRNTNRVDKPEWAFANILDQIYEHQTFIREYLQPLTTRAGYDVDVKSEFTLLLLPILLSFLRSRIPHLLDHPALLAHTIYQTILFDDAIKTGGFDLRDTSIADIAPGADREKELEWDGLAEVVLSQEGWFEQWVDGERKFGESQMNEIISSAEAWTISEDLTEEEMAVNGSKPTISSRQIKALIEQVTDRYSPLPLISHKFPFLTTIQLPLLQSYHARITSSLDAFETISSAFVRAVPGALGNVSMRGGIHVDQRSLTGGVEGLGRLVKAWLSAGWLVGAMREWADDPFFVEMSDELQNTPSIRWKIQSDPFLSNRDPSSSSMTNESGGEWSVWDLMIQRYRALMERGEEMIVRLITAEVEADLKKHLQRRWDQQVESSDPETHPSLLSALTTLSTSLSYLSSTLPPTVLLRIYAHLTNNLTTHISHRAIYSGWSKFTSIGGQSFSREVSDFINTSQESLPSLPSEVVSYPWEGLVSVGKVLGLGNEKIGDGLTFQEAMGVAWSGEQGVREFCERLGVEMEGETLQAVLRRRVECWR